MNLWLQYMKAGTLELLRYPTFSVPTLVFPTLLFLVFAAPNVDEEAGIAMAGFAATALLGVAFFQFGVGIAAERSSPWESFLRVLPVTVRTRLAARVGSALLYGGTSTALVICAAVATTPVSLPPGRWVALVGVLLLGGVPFALLGIALGYATRPRAALPVANLLFLALAYVGGLFTGPRHLPESLDEVSRYLPTRQWGELLWKAVEGRLWQPGPLLGLTAYTVAFGALAVIGYRRDEGERDS